MQVVMPVWGLLGNTLCVMKQFKLVVNFYLKSNQHKFTFCGEEEEVVAAAEPFWGCVLIVCERPG